MTIGTFKNRTFYKFSSWHWFSQFTPIINSPIKFVKITFTGFFSFEFIQDIARLDDMFMGVKSNFIFQEWFFETKCVSGWEFQAQNSIFEELPSILMVNKLHWLIRIGINWSRWIVGWFMLLKSKSEGWNFASAFDRISTFQTDIFIENPIFASCNSFSPSNIFVDILRTDLIIV